MLFILALGAAAFFVFLADRSPMAALIVGGPFALILAVVAVRAIVRARKHKPGRAPIGQLSRDEKAKARSKLVKPKH